MILWLFTKTGYFSVVQDRQSADQFHVRARFREDLERLRDAYLQDLEIKHTPNADYAYRAQIDRVTFGELAIALANDVDYDNFKNAVTREQGHDRHMLYLDVWHTMVRAQDEAEQERMMRISRLHARRGHVPGWTGVFEGDIAKQAELDARRGSRRVSIEHNALGAFAVTYCGECDQAQGARHLEGCSRAGEYEAHPGEVQGAKYEFNPADTAAFWGSAPPKKAKKKAAKKNAKARKRARSRR